MKKILIVILLSLIGMVMYATFQVSPRAAGGLTGVIIKLVALFLIVRFIKKVVSKKAKITAPELLTPPLVSESAQNMQKARKVSPLETAAR